MQLECEVSSLTLCFWVFSGFLFRCIDPCLHNQPLQVRSYSVKFPLSPFRCCQAWYSYSVKFPLSHPLLLGVSLVQLQCKVVFFSCCQPTNMKYHLLQSDSDWSRLLLPICWLGLRRVSCCNAFFTVGLKELNNETCL